MRSWMCRSWPDEEPSAASLVYVPGPSVDRANRERARDLALTCFGLLAILAIVLWWSQR